jgi:uncharacterized membrane protein YebE (DUF533 family)
MKSYSLELVERKTDAGLLGKIAMLAAIGAGAYYGYKKITDENKNKELTDGNSNSGRTYDREAHEGEKFTERVLQAAKRVIK